MRCAAWQQLVHQCSALGFDLGRDDRITGDVAAGASKARDEPRADRVARAAQDDRDARRGVLRGERRLGAESQDHLDLESNELFCVRAKRVHLQVGEPAFHRQISAFDPSKLAHGDHQLSTLFLRVRWSNGQDSDAAHGCPGLRACDG